MKQKLILTFLLFGYTLAQAQNVRFTTDGVIEFEKKTNMYAVIKKSINKDNSSYMQSAFDAYKKNQPQFKVAKSTLAFSKDKTMFTPIKEESNNSRGFFGDDPTSSQNNTIFTDLSNSSFIAQKNVYEETYLVKDSTRKINWKVTEETREIAGYECRRANAIVLDSVYVVAFYTHNIPVYRGPEKFRGLPGMILGVALPHENVSWFATSIKDRPVTEAELKAPVKGKQMNNKGLMETIQSALKNWGEYAQVALKAFSL
jgi:GLPGLI family protein